LSSFVASSTRSLFGAAFFFKIAVAKSFALCPDGCPALSLEHT
jgi:hypothetical protein